MRLLVAFLLTALVIPVLALNATTRGVSADHCATLVADLSGPAIDGAEPKGKADWRGNDTCTIGLELKVQLSSVNLPDGTVLTFRSCVDEETGLFPHLRDMTVSGGKAGFELKRSDGDSVPRCDRNNLIEIRHGDTTIASGTWCAPRIQKC